MSKETGFIFNMIYAGRNNIASAIYPTIDNEVSVENEDEDGIGYTVTISPVAISMASAYFEHRLMELCKAVSLVEEVTSLTDLDKMTSWHLVSFLWSDKTGLQEKTLNRIADANYDSDGHYETGNTRQKNRDRFIAENGLDKTSLRSLMKKLM